MTRTNLWQGALALFLGGVLLWVGIVTGQWASLVLVPSIAVGLLLTRRVPENATSWWLMAGATTATLGFAFGTASETIGFGGRTGIWLALFGGLLFITVMATYLGMTPLVFPTGVAFSRWLMWILAVVWAASAVLHLVTPTVCLLWDDGTCLTRVANPIGIGAAPDVVDLEWPSSMVFLASLFCALTLIPRFLRARGTERQQIKWVAAFAGYILLVFFPTLALVDLASFDFPQWIADASFLLLFFLFPITIAIAVLRYRLFDIDRIINRTVVYAIVVGLLALVFAAGAVWIPSLLPFADNNLAVAASTLAVFFLFNPLRRRVQWFVDRRFYRSRYDAHRVAEDFSARLRDQVDPDIVTGEWVDVVQRTMQPASVSVWVREGS